MGGRKACFLFKNAQEGKFVCITHHMGDGGNGVACVGKKILAVLNFTFQDILFDTVSEQLLIFVLQVGRTNGNASADYINRPIIFRICINIIP